MISTNRNRSAVPRVLTVVAGLGLGGTEKCAQNYAIMLSRSNVTSAVFAYRSAGPRAAALQQANVPIIVADLSAALHWRPDVVHIHRRGLHEGWSSNVIAAFAHLGSTILETNVFGKPDYSKVAARIAVHLQVSEWSLWKWQRRTANIRPRPTGVVFPYAVDTDAFRPLSDSARAESRAAMGILPDTVLLGRVGRPSEAKWDVDMVHAFDRVARHDRTIHLALVGPPPSVLQAIDRLHRQLKQRVHVTPAITSDEELRRFYSSLDCLVHSARIGESFGMVVIEALLCGTPVVTRIRLLRDNTQALLVSHRETGLLVATTSGMIKPLCEVIRDRVAYRHRATAARADLVNRFSMDALRMPLCDLVNSAAALNTRSLQDWCVQRFSSRPDVDKMFRLAMNAYGYRRFSAGIARLAHSPTLYRVVALTKHAKLRRLA